MTYVHKKIYIFKESNPAFFYIYYFTIDLTEPSSSMDEVYAPFELAEFKTQKR
jgi:hypothetical protein